MDPLSCITYGVLCNPPILLKTYYFLVNDNILFIDINLALFNYTYYGSKIHQTNEKGKRKRTYQESYHVSYNREGNSYKFSKCKLPLKNANIRI